MVGLGLRRRGRGRTRDSNKKYQHGVLPPFLHQRAPDPTTRDYHSDGDVSVIHGQQRIVRGGRRPNNRRPSSLTSHSSQVSNNSYSYSHPQWSSPPRNYSGQHQYHHHHQQHVYDPDAPSHDHSTSNDDTTRTSSGSKASYQPHPIYNTPAYTSLGTSYRIRDAMKSNHKYASRSEPALKCDKLSSKPRTKSDDGYSIDSFITAGHSIDENQSDNDENGMSIDYGYNDYSYQNRTPHRAPKTPRSNENTESVRSLTLRDQNASQRLSTISRNPGDKRFSHVANRSHALSYGGSTSFDTDDDFVVDDDDDDDDDDDPRATVDSRDPVVHHHDDDDDDDDDDSDPLIRRSQAYNNTMRTRISTSRSTHFQLRDHSPEVEVPVTTYENDGDGDDGDDENDDSHEYDSIEYDSDFSLQRGERNRGQNNIDDDWHSGAGESLSLFRDHRQQPRDLAAQHHRVLEFLTSKSTGQPTSPSIDPPLRSESVFSDPSETFEVSPVYAYPNVRLTQKQLRMETNAPSTYYHDLRSAIHSSPLFSQKSPYVGQLRLEVLQCFGLPTISLVKEASAYAVAVHGSAAFQTDVIPSTANPMWLSKMRRACLFPVEKMYSKLYVGIFDLEPLIADPDTIMGHPGHPGWAPPRRWAGFGGDRRLSPALGRYGSSVDLNTSRRGSPLPVGGGGGSIGHGPHQHNHGGRRPRRSQFVPSNPNSGDEDSVLADDDDNDDASTIGLEYCTKAEDFLGHVVIDLCKLRPGSTYDVTLPLRRSTHVFARESQGSVRLRLHLVWNSERKAVMSYLPKSLGGTVNWTLSSSQRQPNTKHVVHCVDDRAARNVAHAIHGIHMPGKFDITLVKSTLREVHWTRIHVFRYLRKKELYNLSNWVYPAISGFVYVAWMHAVYCNTVRFVPGHIVVFFLLHLLKNYSYYAMDSPLQNGFLMPTIEELYSALVYGGGTSNRRKRRHHKAPKPCIEPLTVERQPDDTTPHAASEWVNHRDKSNRGSGTMDELYDDNGNLVHVSRFPLEEIADAMRTKLGVQPYRKGFTFFRYTFQGDDAVDFLVNNGFALTRPEAVALGRRLEHEKRLFEHVEKEEYFEDSALVYTFTDYNSDRYIVQKTHIPRGRRLLKLLGFYVRGNVDDFKTKKRSSNDVDEHHQGTSDPQSCVGGADILQPREHMEFPFATGIDHPRFTVLESLAIRSPEELSKLQNQIQARDVLGTAEFGIVPPPLSVPGNKFFQTIGGYDSETGTKMTGTARRTLRRSSSIPDMENNGKDSNRVSQLVSEAVIQMAIGANVVAEGLSGAIKGRHQSAGVTGTMPEVAWGDELYKRLRDQDNVELDKAMELQRKAEKHDPNQYDSDNDVGSIQKKKRKKYVILEKHLKKPMSQEIGGGKYGRQQYDMSLAKVLGQSRRQVHKMFNHMFDDPVYKIDKNLYSSKLEETTEKEIKNKSKRGFFNRRVSNEEIKLEEERQKRLQMTPYERQKEELDKVLLINAYSHSNPWINRVAIVLQPLVEMAQTFLYAIRATFNVFTWQDPVLCFWLCLLGLPLALILYLLPYRILFFIWGTYWIGPQNYLLRIYKESRPGYEPPDFDLVVKKKKIEKIDDLSEPQFFSSEAPGNQQIRFRNIDPTQVKQIVVPSNVLTHNRFYDWPPEPEYARAYASPPPENLEEPGFVDDPESVHSGSRHHDEFSEATYFYNQATRLNSSIFNKKKKKKRGFRKVASKINMGKRRAQTREAAKPSTEKTAKISSKAVKRTNKEANRVAKGKGNFLRLRRRKKANSDFDVDDDYR